MAKKSKQERKDLKAAKLAAKNAKTANENVETTEVKTEVKTETETKVEETEVKTEKTKVEAKVETKVETTPETGDTVDTDIEESKTEEIKTDGDVKRDCQGTISFYKQKLGFGFIKFPEIEGGTEQPDMFLHYTDVPEDLKSQLKPEVKVEFDAGTFDHPTKGKVIKAINLRILE